MLALVLIALNCQHLKCQKQKREKKKLKQQNVSTNPNNCRIEILKDSVDLKHFKSAIFY